MDMGTALELFQGAWPSVQPALSTAFGALVANLFLRSNTSKAEIERLKQVKFSEIADRLLEDGHITHLEYYKCRNFNKIAQKADEVYRKKNIPQGSNSSDAKFSLDWFVRFFEDAGNISDEQMQELWAKVLAGEIYHPGTFSLRTLDVLRNLSREEAEVLQTLGAYAFTVSGDTFICINKDLESQYDYRHKLLTMYDCGFIENNIASHYDIPVENDQAVLKAGPYIAIAHCQASGKLSIDMQRFTKIGKEFLRFTTPNNEYMLSFLNLIKQSNPDLSLSAHRIVQESENTFMYENECGSCFEHFYRNTGRFVFGKP